MNRLLVALCWLASLGTVGTVAWKEGRGKTYDEAQATHQARNDLRARMEVDSLILARTKAVDDSVLLEQQNAVTQLERDLGSSKCT